MKLLVIDEEFPYPLNTGKRLRTFNLTYQLTKHADVSYLAYGDENSEAFKHFKANNITPYAVQPVDLRQSGLKFYFKLFANLFSKYPYIVTSHYSQQFADKLNRLVEEEKFDVVIVEWTPYAKYIEQLTSCKKIIVAHNIESDIWKRYSENETNPAKRFYIKHQYSKLIQFEKECFNWVEGATAVSAIDASFIEKLNLKYKPAVIENGVDLEFFHPMEKQIKPNRLVFTGSMDWRPNQDAAEFFVKQIFPLLRKEIPDIEAYFVGRKPPQHIIDLGKTEGIVITGMVDDVRDYIAEASVYIVPLRIGGGSRLKILEAMGMKKPIVSTSIGAEGLEVTDKKDILIGDTPEEFCRLVLNALADRQLADSIAQQGYELVHAKYKWSSIAEKLIHYLKSL
ncbi:MAG: glycosyltransferase [Calditrichaeota bacterium]|nr:MAG: glycosyltransferase [Calditrichota bacterium]